MTPLRARQILIAYRPGTSDENDPDIAEALKWAASNPELKAWLHQQHEFQSILQKHLRGIQPPATLKNSILNQLAPRPLITPVFRRKDFLAWAAAILIIAAGAALWFAQGNSARSFAAFRSRMVNFALRTYQMDIVSTNTAAVWAHLANRGGIADVQLPAPLLKMPVKGGGRLSWQNQPVSMICFELPKNETLFLFILDRNSLSGPLPPAAPVASQGTHLATVEWTRGNRTFLIAANAPPETLLALAADSPPQ